MFSRSDGDNDCVAASIDGVGVPLLGPKRVGAKDCSDYRAMPFSGSDIAWRFWVGSFVQSTVRQRMLCQISIRDTVPDFLTSKNLVMSFLIQASAR